MYGNELKNSQVAPAPYSKNAAAGSDQMGIRSAVGYLLEVTNQNRTLSRNLAASLGIATTEKDRGPAQPVILVEAIGTAARIVVESNAEIEDCLRHLNS